MANLQLQDLPGGGRTLITVGLLACLAINIVVNCSKNAVPSVTVQQLEQLAKSGEDMFLLDVRTEPEYIANRLSFTDLRVSHDSLGNHLDQLPQDKDTRIYCFCRSGRRSTHSTRYLMSLGYNSVYNVTGGILAWQKKGFETVSGPESSDSTSPRSP
ncbi:MAG: rhodanese-like domain-containing protein [Candidatus Zixiibacteriota bacterium]|nr:MAG: rhodanese-like domain-containing protein [candidate division Zixibacteria bacterium]